MNVNVRWRVDFCYIYSFFFFFLPLCDISKNSLVEIDYLTTFESTFGTYSRSFALSNVE